MISFLPLSISYFFSLYPFLSPFHIYLFIYLFYIFFNKFIIIISDVTNLDINSRSTVNEYGGGDFYVFNDSNLIITNDLNTKNLKMINEDKNFINLTPPNDPIYRYAEMINDPLQRGYIYAIREDHTVDEPSKVVHTIVAIPCPQNFQV